MTSRLDSDFTFLNDRVVKIAIFLGIILRLHEAIAEEIEPDEMHQWYLAISPDIQSIFSDHLSGSYAPHPSGSFILMWLWGVLFGHSVIVMRIPSIIFGILTMIFCGLVAKDFFGNKAGKHAVILTALISDFIRISAQARMYSMMVFLVVLLIWLVNRRISSKFARTRLNFFLIGMVCILLSHTHYFGTMAAFGVIFTGILIRKRQIDNFLNDFLWLMVFLVLGYLPQIPFMLTHLSGGGASYIEQYIKWSLPFVVVSRQLNGSMIIALGAISFVVFCLKNNWAQLEKEEKHGWYLLSIWWLGCFGISAIISIAGPDIASPANLRIIMPASVIALAGCTSLFHERHLPTFSNSAYCSTILMLALVHLLVFNGVLGDQNPEIETAFADSGEIVIGEKVVLVSNYHGLLWEDQDGRCRFCYHIQGEIVDTILLYPNTDWGDDFESRLKGASVILIVELEDWVSEYSESENNMINSYGQLEWSEKYKQVNSRVISLDTEISNDVVDLNGSIGFQEGVPSRIKFDVNNGLICGISDNTGEVFCNTNGGIEFEIFEESPNAESIHIGEDWVCILDSTYSVNCTERHRMTGIEGNYSSNNEIRISIDEPISTITSGDVHFCVLTSTRSVYCWWQGENDSNSEKYILEPRLLIDGRSDPVRSISSAGEYSCFVKFDFKLDCREFNSSTRDWPDRRMSVDVDAAGITTIAIGTDISCYLDSKGGVGCWDEWSEIEVIFPFVDTTTYTSISIENSSVCAISLSGEVRCWNSMTGTESEIDYDAYPAIAVSDRFVCYIIKNETTLTCATRETGNYESVLGGITLADFDIDNDLVIDSVDSNFLNASVSVFCPAGEYGSHQCKMASPGHMVPFEGQKSQTPCDPGTFQPKEGSISCNIVPENSYAIGFGSTHPVYCDSGWYIELVGSSEDNCIPSQPGSFLPIGEFTPALCEKGSYQPIQAKSSCILASPGHFVSEKGSVEQERCNLGSFQPNFGGLACLIADLGFFVDSIGSDRQEVCPDGSYTEEKGSTSPTMCNLSSPGFYEHMGFYIPCPEGTFQPDSGKDLCMEAEPGHYVSSTGSSSQTPASRGHYVEGGGGVDQTPCPVGSYTESTGSDSLEDCTISAPGFTAQGGVFLPCPPGSYQPDAGRGECNESELGTYNPNFGATSAIFCPSGSYTASTGSDSLDDCAISAPGFKAQGDFFLPCPLGFYQPDPGKDLCMEAEPGHYVSSTGSSSQTPASRGHYVEGGGGVDQTPCPVGSYQPETGMDRCMEAEPGHYTQSEGSFFMMSCLGGSYQNEFGKSYCNLAAPGHYVPSNSSFEELMCPIGEYQNSNGSTECIASEPGFYVDSDQRTEQLPCPSGTYSPTGGIDQAGCIRASPGNFSLLGSTEQIKCEKGYFQPSNGQSSCLRSEPGRYVAKSGMAEQEICPAGTYQPNFSSTNCLESPENTFSPPGSIVPHKCPFGGVTLVTGAKYWSDCFIDSDNDGVSDYEDSFPNSASFNNMIFFYFVLISTNILAIGLVSIIVRRG